MSERPVAVGIISAGNKRFAGRIADPGLIIRNKLETKGFDIQSYCILPDDIELIKHELERLCNDENIDLVVTTGGTGYSPADCMPEATRQVAEKLVPSLTEAMRFFNSNIMKGETLSRGVSAILNNTLIINLPDHPKTISDSLDYVLNEASGQLKRKRNSAN